MYLAMNCKLDTTLTTPGHVTTDHKSTMYNFSIVTWKCLTRGRSGECLINTKTN